jgi:hypothetical protein
MTDNRFSLTGTLVFIGESLLINPYFTKRECKIRFSDSNLNGQIVERRVKIEFQNDKCDLLDGARVEDVVQIDFYMDGKDVKKIDKEYNFTMPVGYDIIIMNSPSRSTEESRNAVITKDGLEYKEEAKEVIIEDLMGVKKEIKKDNKDNGFSDLPF